MLYAPVNGRVVSITDGVPRGSNIQNGGNFIGNQIVIELDGAFDSDGNAIPGTINQVILDHLDPGILVENQQLIQTGEPLGRTDNTGNTSIGPHLHLEFKVYKVGPNGPYAESINPRHLIGSDTCD